MKVDCWLCQPAGTPIFAQTGRRLRVTFCAVDVETDVLRPIHVSVERCITPLTDVQASFDTLTVVFSTADTTRLACVALRYFYDLDSLDLRFVRENLGEAVERPPVQVKVSVPTPVLRLAVLVFTDTSEFANVDAANTTLDTLLNDAFGETVEEVCSSFRPLMM